MSNNSSLYKTAPASSGLYSFNNNAPASNPAQARGGPPRGAPGGPPRGAGGPPRGGSNQSDSPASPNPGRGAPGGPPRGAGGPPRGAGGPPRGGSNQSDAPPSPNAPSRGAPQSRGAPPPARGAAPPRGAPANRGTPPATTPASPGLYSTGNYTPAPTPTPPNPAPQTSSGLYNTTNYTPKPTASNHNPAPATSGLYATGPRSPKTPPSNPASSGLYASANQLGSAPASKTVNALVEAPASRPPPQLQSNQSSGNISRTRAGVTNMAPVRPVATAPPTPSAPKPNEPIELSDYNWCFKAIRGENLAAKDANGLSDPYLIVELFVGTENNGEWSVSKTMHKTVTPVAKETLNPEWNFDAFVLNADQAWGKFNGVKITCMDKDLVGADDFMGEVYLGFDVDLPAPPASKKIQVNVKPRPKKKDKVSGFLVFESSFQPVPGSAADGNSGGPGTLRRNKSQSSLKSAAIQKSNLVQISATGRREIKVTSTLQGGYITYGELPPFEIDGDGANQTKNERKYGYNSNLAMWMVTCCQLAYRNASIAGEVARNVWDMYDFHFIDNEQTDTQGFCMHNDKFVVVCFRGTESIRDWMTNLNFLMCANPQFPQRYLKAGVRVHTGFSEALSSVWPEIEAFVTKAYRSFPGLKLYICGHSLGGALANLCFSYFVLSDRPRPVAAVYTVGQPRAGNKKFKEQLELAAPNTSYIRVTNNQDCVPSLAGGQHCGVHLHITATGSFTFDPPTWRKAVTKAQSIQGSAASLNYGGLQDHGTHVYRKRIEAHWIKLQMAKAASNDGAFDLCEQALFIMDLLTEDIKAVRRYKPQFRAILAQVIKLRPLIEAVQDYLGGGVDPRSRHKLKELLATFFELLSKLRKQVIARHSKKSVLQSAGKNSAKAFNEKMTKEARTFQTVSDGINNTLKSAQLVPQTSSLYSWAEASTVTKWTGAEYDVSFNSIDFFAISAATKAKTGEVTHVSKLIEAVEAMVEENKLEAALQSLNAITSGSGSVGALSPEDQVLVAFLTAKIHAKLHHHNEALSALQSVSNTGLINSAMFGDSAFTTLKNQAGFAALQQNWANASVQSSDEEALVAKMNNFEIHSLSRLFDDADDNGDNFLTTEEFQGLLQSTGLDEILDNLGWAEEGVDKTPVLNGILADMRRKYHNAADLDQFISLMARLMPR